MTSSEIRTSYLEFFKERGHTIVPSAPVIPFNDPTLLFANAGLNQFKDVFLGTGKRSYTRAADTQKCIRVSGKHNDLEEVGRDTYHHTFFEMLGNWSFGDYYKKEAIAWAWELLTGVWRLPKNRLWATVYKDDGEAEECWKAATDIDPKHILRFGEKDNFWEMGETGPCGPCSEIHFDRTAAGNATAAMVNAGTPDIIEIWNLVFIQYDRDSAGTLASLPAKHVDTGMGFERICAVLQGKNSNYDTDVFAPLIKKISEISGKPYSANLQSPIGNLPSSISNLQSSIDTAIRVIADHIRTLTFAIGDGAIPSNEGRGYVLRRILRRAARFGRNLEMHEPFMSQLVPTLVETVGDVFPEIIAKQGHIQKVIHGEEEGFNATLDNGLEKFEEILGRIGKSKIIPGNDAFKLYDTYGFPLDLTELMATERGLKVDAKRFSGLMDEQKSRSRTSGKSADVSGLRKFMAGEARQTEFVGYTDFECEAHIISLAEGFAILDRTPFYAESGGQVGDTGVLIAKEMTLHIIDTLKDGNVFGHRVEETIGKAVSKNVIARVDIPRRLSIMRNHSATHLLHNALRRILGTHVQQAGSLVAPDYLRFDFTHYAKLSEKELADIEALVNEKIKENIPRTPNLNNIPFEEAKNMGALMFFGDKYGDRVNVVQFGDFSTEFCGGTHVSATGEIGYFKIRSEGSIASGVRRIEAVTNDYALEYLKQEDNSIADQVNSAHHQLKELSGLKTELESLSGGKSEVSKISFIEYEKQLESLKAATTLPEIASVTLAAISSKIDARRSALNDLLANLADAKKSLEKELSRFRLESLGGVLDDLISSAQNVNGIKVVAARVAAGSMDDLKSLGDSLRAKLGSGIGVLGTVVDDKVQLVCVVTDDLVKSKRADAGKIVGAMARLLGGGGGGRPHMATAGAKETGRLDDALAKTVYIVQSLSTGKS